MTADLRTRYLGLDLSNPLVVSSCPLTGRLESLQSIERAGAAAAVLPSLFEEQIVHDQLQVDVLYHRQAESYSESLSYFPEMEDYNTGPEGYLEFIQQAKQTVSMPIIASLNGATLGGWTDYARYIQDAGADALELNIYIVPTSPNETTDCVEEQYLDLLSAVRQAVTIPLAVKIGPYFSSLPNMAARLFEAGADGLVLFNRYLHPDIDLEQLTVSPHLVLSSSEEALLPLRWIAILRSSFERSLAATSGVHTVADLVKLLLAGADVVMVASSLLQQGPRLVGQLLAELRQWLDENEYESVEQMTGSMSSVNCPDRTAYQRANYMKALTSFVDSEDGPH